MAGLNFGRRSRRACVGVLGAVLLASAGLAVPAAAQDTAGVEASQQAWSTAAEGDLDRLLSVLDGTEGSPAWLVDSVARLKQSAFTQTQQREEELKTKREELETQLAEAREAGLEPNERARRVSDAVLKAIEIEVITPRSEKPGLLASDAVREARRLAEEVAAAAEARQEWLLASELYFRLDALFENQPVYDDDVRRLTERLLMLQLYAPERSWELRNARRLLEGESELPPYNPLGDSFESKLAGIDSLTVRRAIEDASSNNVEGVPLSELILGGLERVRHLATTTDLWRAFPKLNDERQVEQFIATVDTLSKQVREVGRPIDSLDLRTVINRLTASNRRTIGVMEEALLHEFGNGAYASLDQYSSIIWPDEMRAFRRSLRGQFVGIGVQIRLDEQFDIEVVTPLEGTPAQRAGVRRGDRIKKVNGNSIVGFSLNQAVDLITGPAGTGVTITVEREDQEGQKVVLDYDLVREQIDLPSVKGWKKTGPGDDEWDWFIDRDRGIGYVRLTSFTEQSTQEFDAAISEMREQGLKGLVFDLRFNPGGLLDQAVSIASRFVDSGMIVKTVGADGLPRQVEMAQRVPASRRVDDVPVVVLINEGSASASEIVSGAIQAHATTQNDLRAVLVGTNSFGKGSVQNVAGLTQDTAIRITTQYYLLRTGRQIHKTPGAEAFGIRPDLAVEMLPEEITNALLLRQNADVLLSTPDSPEPPDPAELLAPGGDLQLQTALVLLQSQQVGADIAQSEPAARR